MKLGKLQLLSSMALFLCLAVLVVMPATAAAEVSVTRDLPDEPVQPGQYITVTVHQSGFFQSENITIGLGRVIEKLPEGFKYPALKDPEYNETRHELTLMFSNETSRTYGLKAGTAEEIENVVFSGTYETFDDGFNRITGPVTGDTTLTLAEPTPTPTPTEEPTPTPTPSGGGGGGGGGGGIPTPTIPPTPPAEMNPYLDLNATPAEIPADRTSTSTITAFVWNGDEWVMENLTVYFSTSLGEITASAPVVNGSATGILTAGPMAGTATVTAEANLSGDIGMVSNTTTVTFAVPTITPTATPVVTPTLTPTGTPGPTQSPSPSPKKGLPGFEAVFAISGLLAVAYLVLRKRKA
jgi:PGF-CTERM protein